jgi:hypothetical protein
MICVFERTNKSAALDWTLLKFGSSIALTDLRCAPVVRTFTRVRASICSVSLTFMLWSQLA